jgi:hypothetical protein
MANQEDAFVKAMRLAANDRPECFTIKDGDVHFLDWRLTAWIVLAMGDTFSILFDYLSVEAAA